MLFRVLVILPLLTAGCGLTVASRPSSLPSAARDAVASPAVTQPMTPYLLYFAASLLAIAALAVIGAVVLRSRIAGELAAACVGLAVGATALARWWATMEWLVLIGGVIVGVVLAVQWWQARRLRQQAQAIVRSIDAALPAAGWTEGTRARVDDIQRAVPGTRELVDQLQDEK
jgi:uncharacterized membrane protein